MVPTTFTLFPKLPAELQLLIWEEVEIPASVITVEVSDEMLSETFNSGTQPSLKFKTQLHAMFSACYTSRKTALRWYPLCFGGRLIGPCFATPFPFNAEKDVLFFKPMDISMILALNCLTDFDKVRQIAVEPGYMDDYSGIVSFLLSIFRIGRSLENIHIVPNDDCESALGQIVKRDGTMDCKSIGNTLLPQYLISLVVMELQGKLSGEEKDKLMCKEFCVMSPTDFVAKFESPGGGQECIECGYLSRSEK